MNWTGLVRKALSNLVSVNKNLLTLLTTRFSVEVYVVKLFRVGRAVSLEADVSIVTGHVLITEMMKLLVL